MNPDCSLAPIHLFRAGIHRASDGSLYTVTDTHLAASAAGYNPALHEAPLVIGHPKHAAPAYGAVGRLAFAAPDLYAHPCNVEPSFAELVRAKRFSRVSASFYVPSSPDNPKPGVYYLRHVGFLGAQAPALKGLKPVDWGEQKSGVIEVEELVEREKVTRIGLASLTQRKEIAAFVGELVSAGRVSPRDQAGLAAFMAGPNEAGMIEFVESGGATVRAEPAAWFRAFVSRLPASWSPEKIADAAITYREQQRRRGIIISTAQAVRYVTGAMRTDQ